MQEILENTALDKIKKLNGHAKSEAIENFVKNSNNNIDKISILIFALNDFDYSFCTYETCVKSAAAYLYDLRDFLTNHPHRKYLLKTLLDNLDVNFSNTDDNLERIRLLGVFKGEAKSALKTLKLALDDFDNDIDYSNEEWHKNSFEYECYSTLISSINLIENELISALISTVLF